MPKLVGFDFRAMNTDGSWGPPNRLHLNDVADSDAGILCGENVRSVTIDKGEHGIFRYDAVRRPTAAEKAVDVVEQALLARYPFPGSTHSHRPMAEEIVLKLGQGLLDWDDIDELELED